MKLTNRLSREAQFYPKADAWASDESSSDAQAARPAPLAVADACRSAGFPVTRLEPVLPAGTFHALFRGIDSGGRRVFVKCGLAPSTATSLGIEARLSRALAGASVPHARVLASDVTTAHAPFAFMIMEDVAGEPLTTLDGDEARLMDAIESYAAVLRSTHTIGGRGFGLLMGVESSVPWAGSVRWWDYVRLRLHEHCSILTDAGVITVAQRERIALLFECAPTEHDATAAPRLLHGDCGMHNVMFAESRGAVLIDWEDALLGDPLFEIAQWATFQPERRWETFFASYFGERWSPERLFWLYFLRIALAKQVVRLRFGYHDLPGRTPAATRIFTALDRLAC